MTELQKAIATIIATAWADPNFARELESAGDDQRLIETALARKKLKLPAIPDGAKVRFMLNTKALRFVVIPERPEFTDEDMGLIVRLRQEQSVDTGCHNCKCGPPGILDDITKKILGNE